MSVRRERANRLAEVVNGIRLLNHVSMREWQAKYPELYEIAISQPVLAHNVDRPLELVMLDNLRTELQLRTADPNIATVEPVLTGAENEDRTGGINFGGGSRQLTRLDKLAW